jgi:hypothetical protein
MHSFAFSMDKIQISFYLIDNAKKISCHSEGTYFATEESLAFVKEILAALAGSARECRYSQDDTF